MMEVGEFHWSDGLYFKRMDLEARPGDVRIIKVAPDGTQVLNVIIPAPEWESIIASMSAKGEPRNYEAAIEFHMAP